MQRRAGMDPALVSHIRGSSRPALWATIVSVKTGRLPSWVDRIRWDRWLVIAGLGAIVVVAIALRFADLATNPGGLFPDEAAEGIDARRILHEPGFLPVFLPSDGGREATFAYLAAGAFAIAGETTTVLRATAAVLGVVGVLAIVLLARRFGSIAALAAGAWAAGSLWLVCVSRDGLRNILVVPACAVALIALLHWQSSPGRRTAILAGAATSFAALYTYQPLKLLPLLVVAWLFVLNRIDREWLRRLRPSLMAFVAAFVVVALPMAVAAGTDPANYFGRAAAVSPLNPGVQSDSDLVGHVMRTLGMFAVTGDPNGRHDVGGLPLLGWPLSVVAMAGVLRLWRNRRDPAHVLVLLGLGVFLVPPLVATEGFSPHFLRSLGLAVPLGVTIGLGASELVGRGSLVAGSRGAFAVAGALVGGFVLLAAGSGSAYLGRPVADRAGWYSYDLTALASAADSSRDAAIVDGYGAMSVTFLDGPSVPTIVAPGEPITSPGRFDRVVALRREDLVAAVGPALAAAATQVAPLGPGLPIVWVTTP